jgi:hypothetical protein
MTELGPFAIKTPHKIINRIIDTINNLPTMLDILLDSLKITKCPHKTIQVTSVKVILILMTNKKH